MLFTLIVLTGVTGVLVMTVRASGSRLHCPESGTFRCRVGHVRPEGRVRWDRRRCTATWRHDVLVLRFGRWRGPTITLPVRLPEEPVAPAHRREPGRIGADPLRLRLRLDDDRLVDVVAAGDDRTLLVGPFLTAALPGLPGGPREPRRRGF